MRLAKDAKSKREQFPPTHLHRLEVVLVALTAAKVELLAGARRDVEEVPLEEVPAGPDLLRHLADVIL